MNEMTGGRHQVLPLFDKKKKESQVLQGYQLRKAVDETWRHGCQTVAGQVAVKRSDTLVNGKKLNLQRNFARKPMHLTPYRITRLLQRLRLAGRVVSPMPTQERVIVALLQLQLPLEPTSVRFCACGCCAFAMLTRNPAEE